MKNFLILVGLMLVSMLAVSAYATTYPTAPTNFGWWGNGQPFDMMGYYAFPNYGSEGIHWDVSTTNQSSITYDCRWDDNFNIVCGLQPPAQVIYEFQWTNDSGSTWHNMSPYNYSGCPNCFNNTGGNWDVGSANINSYDFPNGNLSFRIRGFDGFTYSDWVTAVDSNHGESTTIANCKSTWTCTAENTSSCDQYDNKYTCLSATDTSGCGYGNMSADDLLYNQVMITNRSTCGCQPNYVCTDHSFCHRNYNMNKVSAIQVCTKVTDTNHCYFNGTIKRKLDKKDSNSTNLVFKIDKKYNDWWNNVSTITCLEESSKVKIEIKGYATNISSPNGKLKISYETNSIIPPPDISQWLNLNSSAIVLNSEEAPEFDKPATIEMTQLLYTHQPTIWIDRGYLGMQVCGAPYCTNINWKYDSKKAMGDLSFKVTGFSGYYMLGYQTQGYTTGDLVAMTTDGLGIALYQVVTFIGVIVLIGIVIFGANKLKKLKMK